MNRGQRRLRHRPPRLIDLFQETVPCQRQEHPVAGLSRGDGDGSGDASWEMGVGNGHGKWAWEMGVGM